MGLEILSTGEKRLEEGRFKTWKDYTISFFGKVLPHKSADEQSLQGDDSPPDKFGEHPADHIQVLSSGEIRTNL